MAQDRFLEGGDLSMPERPEALGARWIAGASSSLVIGQKSAVARWLTTVENLISGISAVGSAGGLGPSGREFESPISDQRPLKSHDFRGLFL